MNFFEFDKKFPTEEAVIEHFITIRYPNGVTCNHCGNPKVYQKKKKQEKF